MRCDTCDLPITGENIQTLGSFGQPMIFCGRQCIDKFYGDDEKEEIEIEVDI